MPSLSRGRNHHPHREGWHVYFCDVRVGTIGRRAGVPVTGQQWSWSCGFYPGLEPGQHRSGVAESFEDARTRFEADWNALLPQLSEASFEECRRSNAFHAWKDRMWASGCRMPTQETSGRSRCFCGAEIGVACEQHIYACHMDAA